MDLCLTHDPCGFVEEGDDGGVVADGEMLVPDLYSGVINSYFYVLQWRHAWGKNVELGNVCCHIQVIDGQKPLGIIVSEDVGSYGGDKC